MRITLDGEAFDLTPNSVRRGLVGHTPEALRQYWVEIDGVRWPVKQVISLATGVDDRQRFQSQAARRWLLKLGFPLGGAKPVERVAAPPVDADPTKAAEPPRGTTGTGAVDAVLVGCVKSKLSRRAVAKELYVSDYFAKMRRYAEGSGLPWFILSAEHGLVSPDQWLEPYERYLPTTSSDYQQLWGQRVAAQCEEAMGTLSGVVLEVHAGAAYVEGVRRGVEPLGAQVRDPLKGLSFGRRLAWYNTHAAAPEATASVLLTQLNDWGSAKPLSDFVAQTSSDLRVPGVYSWWVDNAGAEDLSRGLGHLVAPGLIYAGLAGATRVNGKASSNTLWGRIATMHLGRKHQFSTLRLSLGSILAEAHGTSRIDEQQLTEWMYAHLRVVAAPVGDADTLDALETDILRQLDPPLNLAKVSRTPSRQRLSALRSKYGAKASRPDQGLPAD